MACDWIKMRSHLWTEPGLDRLHDLTDQRSEEGLMPDMSFASLDRRSHCLGWARR